ncbi:MAG: DAK2 domain-containing protein [Candidatus Dormibacteraeota bacterium]|nr:DAK2 domain-containing protein [Candidatus Dormibacteraeota bacterium]MBO0760028.1 DAK2 domain-containing protein [Candidatus Dormibacteraeota bacterium]
MNNLNVFPVPDGDTGTNMLLTLQSAVEDIRESPTAEVGKIARIAAHGSLMGARGNSGVILSQIFRGFANAVQGKAELTPVDLGGAFEESANAAYRAVIKPTEGTILTVAREAGRAAVAASREPGASRVDVIKAAARAARLAVERTPSQLRILREAGVVDAGGYGLQLMLEGMVHSVQEQAEGPREAVARPDRQAAAQVVLDLPEEGWGYCTEFLVAGQGLDVDALRGEIAAEGNSVLVVGDPELVKVHVHTEEPTRVINLASAHGRIERLNVGDMSSQHRRIREEAAAHQPEEAPAGEPVPAGEDRDAEPPRANGIGLVAVVAGQGLIEIFRSLGVDRIVEGGQTMNPSTQDILQAVDDVPYEQVVLLPNNKNVVLAARQVSELTQKKVRLVETRTVPQGIAAVVAFSPERSVRENASSMKEALRHVHTIEVTRAVRDTRSNGRRVKKGDVIALIDERLKHVGQDYRSVVKAAIDGLQPDQYELVTIYRGGHVSEDDADQVSELIKDSYPGLEVELQAGGQDHYPFILSVE